MLNNSYTAAIVTDRDYVEEPVVTLDLWVKVKELKGRVWCHPTLRC